MASITLRQILIAATLLATGAPAAAQADGTCAVAGKSPCVIELHVPHAPKMSANCSAEPWSRYLRFILPDKFADFNKDGWWETVVELVLDPSKECGCAKLRIDFEAPVGGWSVNVGDSPTNNGFGGDAGTTDYAAEMQLLGNLLEVYTTVSPKLGASRFDRILQSRLPPLDGKHVDLEICDQALIFEMPGGLAGGRPLYWKLQTPVAGLLYSLTPRPGVPGPEGASQKDKGLYAGFNRAIGEAGSSHRPRMGTGVRRVEITLSP